MFFKSSKKISHELCINLFGNTCGKHGNRMMGPRGILVIALSGREKAYHHFYKRQNCSLIYAFT